VLLERVSAFVDKESIRGQLVKSSQSGEFSGWGGLKSGFPHMRE
jgi:hypothetical protein